MNTFCAKCGEKTHQKTENLLICNNGHETFINPVVGAVAFILKGDKVLYGIRSVEPNSGGLCAPGGFLDLSETAEEAVIREVKEEMGIEVEIVDILGTYSTLYGNRHIVNIVFVTNYTGGDIAPSDDMNGGDPVWRLIDDLPTPDELAWDWYPPAQKDLQAWFKSNRY